MTEYKYRSWLESVYQAICPDKKQTEARNKKYVEIVMNPDPLVIVEHQFSEIARAKKACGQTDYRWKNLENSANTALEALEAGDIAAIAFAFYLVGEAANQLKQMPDEQLTDLLTKGYLTELKQHNQKLPLLERNAKSKALKEVAQELAANLWEEDKANEIRIGNMCTKVWPALKELADRLNIQSQLPKDIKPWLREVAPEWAKKGGAPTKNDK